MKKKTDYRETLGSFQVHMKDGKEKFLNEVARYYEAMYPARADFFRQGLRRLREINKNSDGSYRDAQGREWRVTYRVPTELLTFIQRWVPDFGKESEDIDLLVRVWCDLVRPGKERRKVTRIDWSRTDHESVPRPPDEAGRCQVCHGLVLTDGHLERICLCDDHCEERRREPRENAGVTPPDLPPGM